MKKGDIIVFASIIILSVLLFSFSFFGDDGKQVAVTVDNKPYRAYSLDKNGEYEIKTENGKNTLVISDGAAYFKDSDCPDKTCQRMGKISKAGETIVCLPHKVVAEVEE